MGESLNFVTAFSAGLVSFFAPCLLPLIPSYFSVISGFTFKELYGLNFERIRGRVFFSSLFFVAGFVVFFSLLGATTAVIGQFLVQQLELLTRWGGVLLIILGLIQIGVIRFEALRFDFAWRVQKKLTKLGFLTAFLTGVISGLVWLPCIGPVLGAILLLASRVQTARQGMILLCVFSLGLASPFLILGLAFPTIFGFLKNYRRFLHILSLFAGVILVGFGLILIFGRYQNLINKFYQLTE